MKDICMNQGADGLIRIVENPGTNDYLPEDSNMTSRNKFKWSDTASIDILRLNSVTGEKYTPYKVTDRSNPSDSGIKLERDGWFTGIHIVVPTKRWADRELSRKGSIIHVYDKVYFANGSEIYVYSKGKTVRTTIDRLLSEDSDNTTISRTETDGVFIDYMLERQKELYTKLFETRMYNGGCGTDACEANRVVSFINLVRHYVRFGQLAEAERIIEKFNRFRNIIRQRKDDRRNQGCGCS